MSNGCRVWAGGHRFDPVSGYCTNDGCGWRDDGRLVINGTEKRAAEANHEPEANTP